MMLLRTVIGVLHEAWLGIVTRRFLSSPQGRHYVDTLDADGKAALENLKRLFGASGLLARIRNDFAFHHPKDTDLETAFQLAASDPEGDADWHWYFAKSGFNSFYFLSEIIVRHGVLQATGAENLAKAQQELILETQTANNEMVTLLQALLASMWHKHFGEEFLATVVANVHRAPNLFEFSLPFFFDVPDVVKIAS